uniref:Uncharacterized protein n=1 Tax=Oryza glumipatula TaxID=40148 RepID=A0A0E0BE14_9ORYZ
MAAVQNSANRTSTNDAQGGMQYYHMREKDLLAETTGDARSDPNANMTDNTE